MIPKHIVGYITDPELEPGGPILLRQRTGKDIGGAPLVVGLPDKLCQEPVARIVI